MTTATIEAPRTTTPRSTAVVAAPVVALKRRTIDSVLIGFGVVATAAFAVAGGLLTWGSGFSSDYVGNELASQNITFPSAAELTEDGRTDLLSFADQDLDTGREAEAYASYIDGHLTAIAGGATYADLGATEAAAKAEVTAAADAGKSSTEVAALQADADAVSGQRNSLFKGETLRGLLLSAYAWSTVGSIAGFAAIGAFVAAGLTAVLVALGLVHVRRTPKTA